jgi:hypothetical protein
LDDTSILHWSVPVLAMSNKSFFTYLGIGPLCNPMRSSYKNGIHGAKLWYFLKHGSTAAAIDAKTAILAGSIRSAHKSQILSLVTLDESFADDTYFLTSGRMVRALSATLLFSTQRT